MSDAYKGLYLHEQILLLALRDDKGTIESKAGWYSLALGGGVLSELLLAGRITIDEGDKPIVRVADDRPLGDSVLDECLGLVRDGKKPWTATRWIQKFSSIKRLRHRVAEGLCDKGVLRDGEDRVLLLFTRKAYPTIDPRPEKALVRKLRDAIRRDTGTVQPRTAILVGLANNTGLLRVLFDRAYLKTRKRRLEQIADGDAVQAAASQAVQAAQAAVAISAAAGAMSTIITTTTAGR